MLDERLSGAANRPTSVEQLMPPDLPTMDPQIQQDMQAEEAGARPTAVPGTQVDQTPGIFGKIVGRLFGMDLEDPMPWTRLGTTIAGSLAGAEIGGRIPGPPMVKGAGALVGGAAGTFAGAAYPEMTMEALEALGILEPGTREKTGLNSEQLSTVMEGEALVDIATMGGVSLIRGAGRGIVSAFTGINRAGRETAEEAARQNIALMPVQVGTRQVPRMFVSVMGRFPWVASTIRKGMNRQMERFQQAFENLPARFGPLATYDEASAAVLRDSAAFLEDLNRTYTDQFTDLLRRADFAGITVAPVNTRAVSAEITKQIDRKTPRSAQNAVGKAGKDSVSAELPPGDRDLRRFLTRTTNLMYDNAAGTLSHQSLRQMNTLLEAIDAKMASYASGGDFATVDRLERLRQAVQSDMISNATGRRAANASTARQIQVADQTAAIVGEFRALDDELTHTVTELVNSAAGSKLGFAQSKTGRGIRMLESPGATDGLAKAILAGNSPQAVTSLARVVTPETMRNVASSVMQEALEKSTIAETGRFDMETLAKTLGLNDRSSLKYAQTRELLNAAGGLNIGEVESLVRLARVASSVELPDVSVMLARRGTLGGIRSVANAVVPGAIVAGGGAKVSGWTGAMVGGLLVLGGMRLVSNMIANPASARAFSRVFDQEAKTYVRRAAFLRAVELGLSQSVKGMGQAFGGMSSEARDVMLNIRDYANEVDKQLGLDRK